MPEFCWHDHSRFREIIVFTNLTCNFFFSRELFYFTYHLCSVLLLMRYYKHSFHINKIWISENVCTIRFWVSIHSWVSISITPKKSPYLSQIQDLLLLFSVLWKRIHHINQLWYLSFICSVYTHPSHLLAESTKTCIYIPLTFPDACVTLTQENLHIDDNNGSLCDRLRGRLIFDRTWYG